MIPSSRDDRAVSGVLSLVLLIGLTVTGVSVVMLVGASAITDTQRETSLLSTEQSMAQFDSRAALVAHGSTTTKHATLSTGGETLTAQSDAGWLNLTIQNATPSGDGIVVVNATLGAVRFHDERTTIAYQGGGVWKKDDTGSVMVSPPEFHY